MIQVINNIFKTHLKKYQEELSTFKTHPLAIQKQVLQQILTSQAGSQIGQHYQFSSIYDYQEYRRRLPVVHYKDIEPFVQKILQGESNILTTSKIKWMAKTAGTTSGKSKYLPVTRENIVECHQKGAWYILSTLYAHREDLQIFAKRNMLFGGGVYGLYPGSSIPVADISAIMIQSIPYFMRPFYIPSVKIATMPDWEEKVERIAQIVSKEDSLTMLGGVPTWNLTLYRRVLELTGADHLLQVWPNIQAYVNGGVSFKPYQKQFREILPKDDILYIEVYNASEGFFAVQTDLNDKGLTLLLNHAMFFEFIPFEAYKNGNYEATDLSEVSVGQDYALVVSTNAGLYRYIVGDVVTFTSTFPFKIKIKGRTQEYINAFGEDLLFHNVEKVLVKVCQQFNAIVKDYTIAPYYVRISEKGRHQWFIEFEKEPADIAAFAKKLDEALQEANSNYQQKRSNDFAITQLEVIPLPPGFFYKWLKRKGKFGGQNKVPKLVNHRRYADDILAQIEK